VVRLGARDFGSKERVPAKSDAKNLSRFSSFCCGSDFMKKGAGAKPSWERKNMGGRNPRRTLLLIKAQVGGDVGGDSGERI